MKHVLYLSLRNLILVFFLIVCLFPLLWVFLSSFKTNREILDFALSLPAQFSFKNYETVIKEPGMIRAFFNSVAATGLSVVLNAFICYIAAYTMSRFHFRFLKFLGVLIAFGLLVPINSALLPLKIVMDAVHLSNSVLGLAILYAGIGIPISTLVLRSHIDGIPKSIDEAAAIDGSSTLRVALGIIAPVARPGLVTVMILQAVASWNEFMFALTMISDPAQKTLQLIIRNFLGLYQSNYGALFASVMVAVVPIIVLFVLFQNKVIEAFTTGAVKA